MTSPEEHLKKIREHLEGIEEAIDIGIEKRPTTIGFHCSAGAMQYLEYYLHITNRIPIGKIIKHDWFKRPKEEQKIVPLIERKMPLNFPNKEKIYFLIYSIEEERNTLMYGKPSEKQIRVIIENFMRLKEIFDYMIKNRGEE
ncbi:hypothetical protein COU61_04895 [Candidatus Pacearchaeota archaeon CG10_big_fil_rev_8_21_14_0_10_35_13]|nr:MAG: hypothetical protein COU61_04895 [Candidatus Pacearchaeota archaeon CG10_big_fil_rev_8_21_14_0_10_35_13]